MNEELTNNERSVLYQLADLGIKSMGIQAFQGNNSAVIQSALAKLQPAPAPEGGEAV